MEIVLWIVWALLVSVAFVGCFISKFPGPLLAFGAILMVKLAMEPGASISWWNVAVIGILVIISMILNKKIPDWTKKLADYGNAGNIGALIGSIVGLVLMAYILSTVEDTGVSITLVVITFIAVPFLFATIFELISQKKFGAALKSGTGATVVYICNTFIKLFTVAYSVYLVFHNS